MSDAERVRRWSLSGVAAAALVATGLLAASEGPLNAQTAGGSPGPLANSCGVPATSPGGGASRVPVFPAGHYPVSLPPASLLGARNDLPNPYQAGVSFGQLPEGRKWGSTASVTAAPDG